MLVRAFFRIRFLASILLLHFITIIIITPPITISIRIRSSSSLKTKPWAVLSEGQLQPVPRPRKGVGVDVEPLLVELPQHLGLAVVGGPQLADARREDLVGPPFAATGGEAPSLELDLEAPTA